MEIVGINCEYDYNTKRNKYSFQVVIYPSEALQKKWLYKIERLSLRKTGKFSMTFGNSEPFKLSLTADKLSEEFGITRETIKTFLLEKGKLTAEQVEQVLE